MRMARENNDRQLGMTRERKSKYSPDGKAREQGPPREKDHGEQDHSDEEIKGQKGTIKKEGQI